MKTAWVWLLALPLGAGVGALVALALAPKFAVAAPVSTTPGAELGAEPDAAWLERLAVLARENVELRERLAALEERPALVARTTVGEFVERAEFDALRTRILEALAERQTPNLEARAFDERVAEALTTIRKEEQFAKVRKSQEQRTQRLDDDVAKVSEWLELDTRQASSMRSALLAQYDREDEVRRLWQGGADDELLGARKREAQGLFRADLEAFLSVDQNDQFWERMGNK